MWICKSEVEVQGHGDLCVVRILGACWAFIMVWNGVRELGGGAFVNGGDKLGWKGVVCDWRRVCGEYLRGGLVW